MTDESIRPATDWLAALAQHTRLRIVHALAGEEATVNGGAAAVSARPENVSHHLGVMHRAGLLTRRRHGASILNALAGAVVSGGVLALAAHGLTIRMRLDAEPEPIAKGKGKRA